MSETSSDPGVKGFLSRHRIVVICLGLVLVTAGLYWPVTRHDFINVDDPRFVTENAQVRAGLTWPGVVWAFHSVYTEAWQPMTWCSHMLDCQMYGLNAGGHHLTSLLWHLANTVLLFLWLNDLTKATWRSGFVAALFAWHPLHVESVAWVCERKDVLSAFFWLAALLAYTRYVRKPGVMAYVLVLVLFELGLMSKPMLVTLPCVLLLLDFWPFNRWQLDFAQASSGTKLIAGLLDKSHRRKTGWLVAEKLPFFALALGLILITLSAQKAGGSLGSLSGYPLPIRLGNALVSYFMYLTTTFWPSGLAYFYPYSFELPLASVIGGALLLAVWTVCVFLRVRQQPGLLVGWFWFVGALVPTIGVVQFCIQARADRYTYIPSIGLFLVVVWGACELAERWTGLKKYLPVAGGLALAGCVAVSSIQITYWQNSLTLSRHAIAVTEGNYVAFESLGRTISAMGQPEHAIPFFADASRLAPSWPQGQFNYGLTLSQLGQTNDAIDHLRAAVKLVPGYAPGRTCLGQALLKFGRTDEAIQEFAEAARLDPQSAEAQLQWGTALTRENQPAEAADHLRAALRLAPGLAAAKTALEQILSSHPDLK